MLSTRLLLALAQIAPILGLCWLDWHLDFSWPEIWLPICLVCAVVSTAEVLDLVAARDHRPVAWPVYLGVVLVVVVQFAPMIPAIWKLPEANGPLVRLGLPFLAMAAATAMIVIVEMSRFEGPSQATVNIAISVFTVAYVGMLCSFLMALRLLPSDGRSAWGMVALFGTIFVAKMCDSGGFIIGRVLGRNPLAPLLSPNKTVEGAVGGVIFAVGSSWFVFAWVAPWLVGGEVSTPWWAWTAYGLAIAAAAMLGDLAESLLKRDMDRKDSGAWIPAFGGALDVLDSILMAAPFSYACWLFGLVGKGWHTPPS